MTNSAPEINLDDLPLGGIRETDFVHVETCDDTCSRCREPIGDGEVPLNLWPASDPTRMLSYCQRCTTDPHSDRCKRCGCTDRNPCDMGCGWAAPGVCTACVDAWAEPSEWR